MGEEMSKAQCVDFTGVVVDKHVISVSAFCYLVILRRTVAPSNLLVEMLPRQELAVCKPGLMERQLFAKTTLLLRCRTEIQLLYS